MAKREEASYGHKDKCTINMECHTIGGKGLMKMSVNLCVYVYE